MNKVVRSISQIQLKNQRCVKLPEIQLDVNKNKSVLFWRLTTWLLRIGYKLAPMGKLDVVRYLSPRSPIYNLHAPNDKANKTTMTMIRSTYKILHGRTELLFPSVKSCMTSRKIPKFEGLWLFLNKFRVRRRCKYNFFLIRNIEGIFLSMKKAS